MQNLLTKEIHSVFMMFTNIAVNMRTLVLQGPCKYRPSSLAAANSTSLINGHFRVQVHKQVYKKLEVKKTHIKKHNLFFT